MNDQNLEIVYNGFGKVSVNESVEMQPRGPASATSTSAALTLVKHLTLGSKFGVRLRYLNVKWLRQPQPNAWEVFWLMFNYRKTSTNKETNYFIFKPNGLELGTAWNELDQKYLMTSEKPQAEWGREYELELDREGSQVQTFIDGKSVMTYNDDSHQLFSAGHSLAFYTEDAKVQIRSLEICQDLP